MSSTPLAEAEENVFDLTEVVPETERLDSSLQKAKAQLTVKSRRHRPSRSRLRDSLSSTEGEDSADTKSYTGLLHGSSSPLYPSIYCTSPFCDLHPSSSPARRDRSFTFDPCPGPADTKNEPRRRALLDNSSPVHVLLHQDLLSDLPQDGTRRQREENHADLPGGARDAVQTDHRDRVQPGKEDHSELRKEDHSHLHQEDHVRARKRDHVQQSHEEIHGSPLRHDHLGATRELGNPRKKEHRDPLQEENHCLLRQREHSQSEDDSHDVGSDEPSSPTVLLDKKSRRRFLDLGVTLWRTYGRVRKERAARHSTEKRPETTSETVDSRIPRSSGPPFVSFSWFSERLRGSGSPKHSSQSPAKSHSEDEDIKPKSRSNKKESSQPYQSLSDLSDEGCDDPAEACLMRKKPILRFSSGVRDRTEKQNGIQRDKEDSGHDGDGQKLLSTLSPSKNDEL